MPPQRHYSTAGAAESLPFPPAAASQRSAARPESISGIRRSSPARQTAGACRPAAARPAAAAHTSAAAHPAAAIHHALLNRSALSTRPTTASAHTATAAVCTLATRSPAPSYQRMHVHSLRRAHWRRGYCSARSANHTQHVSFSSRFQLLNLMFSPFSHRTRVLIVRVTTDLFMRSGILVYYSVRTDCSRTFSQLAMVCRCC